MKHLATVRVAAAFVFVALLTLATTSNAGAWWHTVQYGDSLSSIGSSYGRSVSCLMTANNITNANWVYAGQQLWIPDNPYNCAPPSGGYYYNPWGSHWYPGRFHGYGCYHRVAFGENLFRIALQYRTNYWTLAAANGIGNPNMLYAGQMLFIPGCN